MKSQFSREMDKTKVPNLFDHPNIFVYEATIH